MTIQWTPEQLAAHQRLSTQGAKMHLDLIDALQGAPPDRYDALADEYEKKILALEAANRWAKWSASRCFARLAWLMRRGGADAPEPHRTEFLQTRARYTERAAQ